MSDECPDSCDCPNWDNNHRLKIAERRISRLESALRLVRSREGCNCNEWAGNCDSCEAAYKAADDALSGKP